MAHVSEDLKARFPNVRWRDIKNFRNLLIHGYMHTNLYVVWDITQADLNELEVQIQQILCEKERG